MTQQSLLSTEIKEHRDFMISHQQADEQWAHWITAMLERNGYTCYVMAWDFRAGDNFVLDMDDALMHTDRFIAVVSPQYLNAPYCKLEWTAALAMAQTRGQHTFILARIAAQRPQGLLSPLSYIDLYDTDEPTAFSRLKNGVSIESPPRTAPPFPGNQAKTVRFPGILPTHNLPFPRNVYFTGRDTLLSDIAKKFAQGDPIYLTQAIAGLGGLGKTQTALEYAYRYANQYDYIWWVPAETDSTLVSAYRAFATQMKLLDVDQQNRDVIVQTVRDWLDSNTNWLLIFDNAQGLTRDADWLPRQTSGHILLTTREKQANLGTGVNIDVFTPEEAVAFLCRRTGRCDDDENAKVLAFRLGYLPLALEQAAAYIHNNTLSFDKYMGLLDKYGLSVLKEIDGVIDYKDPVTATWEISFKQIRIKAAKQLLFLCAYLAPDEIDATLFADHTKLLPRPLRWLLKNELQANKVWRELTRYSLLGTQGGKQGYAMHRLLQEVVREKLAGNTRWVKYCLALLRRSYDFKYGDVASHNRFAQLTPHVAALLSVALKSLTGDESLKRIAALYSEGGFGFYKLGSYNQALDWYQKNLAISEKVFGLEHPETATIFNNIASVYKSQGDYTKALEWNQKALAILENVLGLEHPDTATTYNNIAGVYLSQSDYTEALKWYQKALAIREKVLCLEHPDTATTYNNLALVYKNQGDYPKALEMYQKALAIFEKVLGLEHPDTATTYHNIASVFIRQGDYPKALEMYQKALVIKEKALGLEHPSTATTYSNIAQVYDDQGDYPKALEWYQKALPIFEARLGENHPNTSIVRKNMQLCQSNIENQP